MRLGACASVAFATGALTTSLLSSQSRASGRSIAADDGMRMTDVGRAVVVTVSAVPEEEQLSAGIVQEAGSVGLVVNPVTLIWNVKALLADPDCDGCDGWSAGRAVNVVVTLVFALIANVQTGLVLPAHASDQLVIVAFAAGTAVSVMDVPVLKLVPGGDC
jgi:hypothetical protein